MDIKSPTIRFYLNGGGGYTCQNCKFKFKKQLQIQGITIIYVIIIVVRFGQNDM